MAHITESSQRAGAVLELLRQRARLSPRKLGELVGHSHTTVYARLKGADWSYRDRSTYADLFAVPETLFDGSVDDAGMWLIEHHRFTTLDLRDPSDLGITDSPCDAYGRSPDLILSAV